MFRTSERIVAFLDLDDAYILKFYHLWHQTCCLGASICTATDKKLVTFNINYFMSFFTICRGVSFIKLTLFNMNSNHITFFNVRVFSILFSAFIPTSRENRKTSLNKILWGAVPAEAARAIWTSWGAKTTAIPNLVGRRARGAKIKNGTLIRMSLVIVFATRFHMGTWLPAITTM